ncbi:hemolysin family protein [Tessaracoccus oleiagri]|uniref:Hemolysin, contains CBS domains n=1 Tax=Tessaracoccus oleiagri TaxID=686624 RepID=A0A1G9LM64_9ACTN|nr:hemolysin family protein [Tessaracoccus oleiagri]SDL62976.1 Hemolysin, contains CBS domains [Tessaracoccus oleiagri]
MTAAVFTLLLGLVVIALIIAANGYFVAQEFAYMSVDRARLRAAAADGDARARSALEITQRTSFMLSGAQLGITVTGLMIGYVAEPLVGSSLGTMLGGVGVPREVSITVGTVLALAISTVVQMIFGELFPKNYTIAAPLPSALALARSTRIYLALFGWLIRFFDWSANSLLKLLRIEPVHDVDSTATAADLEHIVSASRETGDLTDEQFLTLDRMLDFPDQDVAHAMIPRSRAGVVHPTTTVAAIRELMAAEHTRYPVVDEGHSPVGVVHMLDLLDDALPDDAPVSSVMREPVVLPELMALPDAVQELRARDEQLACVVDEYGGFAGILTIEDLAEEILGDLTDEHDAEDQEEITPTAQHVWVIDGDTHLDEVERAIGHDVAQGDYETLAGLLIAHVGDFPEEGSTHEVELPVDPGDYAEGDRPLQRRLRLTVEEVDRHVPSLVRVELVEDEPSEGEDA